MFFAVGNIEKAWTLGFEDTPTAFDYRNPLLFELVESLLSDWNLTVLRPSARKSGASPATGTPEDNLRLQARLAQGQQILDAHLQQLLETLRKTGESVETVARSQAGLERRVTEIVAWEKDYRSFLATKDKAAAPSPRMSEH